MEFSELLASSIDLQKPHAGLGIINSVYNLTMQMESLPSRFPD
jgi:hypothetical protein